MKVFLAALIAAVVLASCQDHRQAQDQSAARAESTTNTANVADPGRLRGRSFVGTSASENGRTRQFASPAAIRMDFTSTGLRFTAGCNHLSGNVNLDGGRIALSPGVSTLALCATAVMEDEDWLEAFLKTGPAWRLEADRLTLTSSTTVLRLIARVPNAPPT